MVLTTAAVGLWLVFGVGVWLWRREASGGESVLSVCFLVGLCPGVPTALALGSYAALGFRSDRLPGWTASLAAVAALAHLVLLASLLITSGFFSLEGGVTIAIPATLFAWIVGTSVAMMAGDQTEAAIRAQA